MEGSSFHLPFCTGDHPNAGPVSPSRFLLRHFFRESNRNCSRNSYDKVRPLRHFLFLLGTSSGKRITGDHTTEEIPSGCLAPTLTPDLDNCKVMILAGTMPDSVWTRISMPISSLRPRRMKGHSVSPAGGFFGSFGSKGL